jgi:glycerol uptake facilitator protein
MIHSPSLGRRCLAELAGTFLLVFFGCGSVHVAVLTGAMQGLWQVAMVWGLGVALAIYATAGISGAHLNPAITLAFAVYRKFSWARVGPYIVSQLAGAFLAAVILSILFSSILIDFESAHHIIRGQPGSEASAMIYGEYFPNPGAARGWSEGAVSHTQAMMAEGIGTAFLAFFVFALTEVRNHAAPRWLVPLFIGLTVSIIIAVVAPLTQAGLNPARDFGPRLWAWMTGWGDVAIPGPRSGFFTVYILSPILGALAGAGAYQLLLRGGLAPEEAARPATEEGKVS